MFKRLIRRQHKRRLQAAIALGRIFKANMAPIQLTHTHQPQRWRWLGRSLQTGWQTLTGFMVHRPQGSQPTVRPSAYGAKARLYPYLPASSARTVATEGHDKIFHEIL
ncbi:MAG: hypothetical protein HC886_20480 [Leptolyngbyaceae cyanobacterium SM1_1_3]|nr:hypothetical protein [Leptolyngbyaceae cyanobacterium SM1_1_3]NJN04129.1 hypothetical protein [Leptolyngbyaceae cyanobacterium RM1_1_2]NJO09653.1 hypothetical protein [Leptolyngbyaceae cyanobacterium SL_1_1]